MNWSSRFVGIPWLDKGRTRAGVDCWGLIRIVYAEELGLLIPDYTETYVTAAEKEQVAAALERRESEPWAPVAGDLALPYDVTVFREGRDATHVGVVVRRGLMLHTLDGGQTHVARYDEGRWKIRLLGIYRHCEAA